MRAVRIGVHQGHGQRLDPLFLQGEERRANVGIVRGPHLDAARVHAAGDFHGVFQPRHRFGLGPYDPGCKPAGHKRAGDLHHLAIALGDNKPNLGALALQNSICGDGRAMQEDSDLRRRYLGLGAYGVYAVEHPFGTVMRRRRRFFPPECACHFIQQQQVGERAADIDPKAITHDFSQTRTGCIHRRICQQNTCFRELNT